MHKNEENLTRCPFTIYCLLHRILHHGFYIEINTLYDIYIYRERVYIYYIYIYIYVYNIYTPTSKRKPTDYTSINKRKREVMTLNVQDPAPVKVEEDPLPYADQFTYLGSSVRHDGGAGSNIINRIGKARNAFRMLSPVWKSQQYKTHTKLKLYKSCVLSTLLYGSKCWRMTEKDISKLSSFHIKNLRKIVRIFWPQIISNQDLFDECQQESIETTIAHRRWRWIGHVLHNDQGSIPRVAVEWKPEGHRKRRRPRMTWRGTVEAEATAMGHSLGAIRTLAQDRLRWREFVAALVVYDKKGSK